MNEIIKINTTNINGENQPVVCARELHQKLEVKSQFRVWVKRRIEEAQLIESIDFVTTTKKDRR